MNFQVNLTENNIQTQKVINANSWAECYEYCQTIEGELLSINYLPNVIIVNIDNESSTCFQVNLLSNSVTSYYFIWANDYQTFNTWLSSQPDSELKSIQVTNKLYITV
jgi:hypothetical protein